jgi:hypothetical protein
VLSSIIFLKEKKKKSYIYKQTLEGANRKRLFLSVPPLRRRRVYTGAGAGAAGA